MIYCLYHGVDYDGLCSGFLVKYFFEKYQKLPVKTIPFNYGNEESVFNQVEDGSDVYLVDININKDSYLENLYKRCKKVILIDHHKSFKTHSKLFEKKIKNLEIYFDENITATELCYDYFFKATPPYFVWLISKYDIWQHQLDKNILFFQYGLQSFDTNIDNLDYINETEQTKESIWTNLISDLSNTLIYDVINKGNIILSYASKMQKQYANRFAFECFFEGYNCICINGTFGNSKMFDAVYDSKKHDIMLLFINCKGKFWKVSLYSYKENVDVSLIAKKYLGGGHQGAAGFLIDDINLILANKRGKNE